MSLREEDRPKNNCTSRGLGVAAAAIGVGVGAALYYFFSKRPENPNSEGSTTRGWECDPSQSLFSTHEESFQSDDSYTTLSEHSTTDTSINEDSPCRCNRQQSEDEITNDSSDNSDNDSIDSESITDDSFYESDSNDSSDSINTSNDQSNDSQLDDWDVSSSVDMPGTNLSVPQSSLSTIIGIMFSPRQNRRQGNDVTIRKTQGFRDRSWSLEECAICCELMLRGEDLTSLACSHHFHSPCIMTWFQEQETCPICRKTVLQRT